MILYMKYVSKNKLYNINKITFNHFNLKLFKINTYGSIIFKS